MWPLFVVTLYTLERTSTLPCCQSLNKLEYKPAHMRPRTKEHVLWLRKHKHEGHPVYVRGVFEVWLSSDVDEWSVKTMSHSCPTPLYSGEGQAMCVCVCGVGGVGLVGADRGYLCMCSCWSCVQSPIRTVECVLFWQPSVTHVNGMAAVFTRVSGLGSGCEWNGRECRVKHFDPCTTLKGHPTILMGKSMIHFLF